MYTFQVLADTTPCVEFKKCWTPFAPLFVKEPSVYKDWWGWDLSLGSNKWMISMRKSKTDKRPEYMLWKCYNNTSLATSQIVLSTNHIPGDIPKMYLFSWAIFALLNLFSAHGTRE